MYGMVAISAIAFDLGFSHALRQNILLPVSNSLGTPTDYASLCYNNDPIV